MILNRIVLYVTTVLFLCHVSVNAAEPELLPRESIDKGWIQLFDGQTLFGWQPTGDAEWEVDGDTVRTAGTAPGVTL